METESKQPYSIQELMVLHGLSRRSVVRIYEKEPGVTIPMDRHTNGRRYRTIRVPHHVFRRVWHRMEVR